MIYAINKNAGSLRVGLSTGAASSDEGQRAAICLSPPCRRVAAVCLFGIAIASAIDPAFDTRASSRNQIVVGESIRVTVNSERPHVEPNVAVDPKNPMHLVATSIAFTRPDNSFTCAVFMSFDGGRSWQPGDLTSLNNLKLDSAADPWIAFGPRGTVFFPA